MKQEIIPRIGVLLGLFCFAGHARSQVVVLSTDFTQTEGYLQGDLQFQSIANGTVGTWLGHSGAMVDTSGTGTVSRTADPRRNLFNTGATGGIAGGNGSGEILGNGFSVGDLARIEHVYSFEVNSSDDTGLLKTGIRPNYANGGFESKPELGIKIDYSNDGGGILKIFSNLGRSGLNEADDPFAFEVAANSVGIDNGNSGGTIDLQSDRLRFTWEAEYIGSDTWQSNEITIENLDTTFTSTASVENPTALESVSYSDSGVEAFFGMQQVQGFAGAGVTDSIEFLYFPLSGSLPGDFDSDGDVDGADALQWQLTGLTNSDLLLWHSNYGMNSSAARSISGSVPEATSISLFLIGIVLCDRLPIHHRARL